MVFEIEKTRLCLRPLAVQDELALTKFLTGLGKSSKKSRFEGEDLPRLARRYCQRVGRFDWAYFVLCEPSGEIVALYELGMSPAPVDISALRSAGILIARTQLCRLYMCVADHWQRKGVGSTTFVAMRAFAAAAKKTHIIVCKGVAKDNDSGCKFCKKMGFCSYGTVCDPNRGTCIYGILTV